MHKTSRLWLESRPELETVNKYQPANWLLVKMVGVI